MMFTYNRINKQRDEQCRREKIDESRREEFKNMGDASPLFRWESSAKHSLISLDIVTNVTFILDRYTLWEILCTYISLCKCWIDRGHITWWSNRSRALYLCYITCTIQLEIFRWKESMCSLELSWTSSRPMALSICGDQLQIRKFPLTRPSWLTAHHRTRHDSYIIRVHAHWHLAKVWARWPGCCMVAMRIAHAFTNPRIPSLPLFKSHLLSLSI